MVSQYLDVRLEVETWRLEAESDPTRYLIEKLRGKADEACSHVGAHLRTDRAPELLVQQAQHRLTGDAVTLVASRWSVVTPRDLDGPA